MGETGETHGSQDGAWEDLAEEIAGRIARRHSTAAVLFHYAVAERLGLGPTDHKCLDLLRERGALTGSELAAVTGLTSGAITGVVARLERAGYLRREPDSDDGRKQILSPVPERLRDLHDVFGPLHDDMSTVLRGFDAQQLSVVAEFLTRSADLLHRHSALLRSLKGYAGTGDMSAPPVLPARTGEATGTAKEPRP